MVISIGTRREQRQAEHTKGKVYKMKYDEMIKKALEMLEDDELYVEMVNELDCWNGFADGFRCFPMDELDDLFGQMPLSQFLDTITDDFNSRDNYMVDTIYGLSSTDYPAEIYRDNTTPEEVLDNILENANNISIYDTDFEELINEILEAREAA